jgi:hypothetical protein
MQIIRTKVFQRAAAKILSPDELAELEEALASDPAAHPVIPGTGGIRKARWAASARPAGRPRAAGRGKRGGARVIYFHHDEFGRLYL